MPREVVNDIDLTQLRSPGSVAAAPPEMPHFPLTVPPGREHVVFKSCPIERADWNSLSIVQLLDVAERAQRLRWSELEAACRERMRTIINGTK